MTSATVAAPIPRRKVATRIYVPIGILCLVIAVAGFWPSYFGPMLAGAPHALPIIHLHAVVFAGWVVLLIAQAWLAATGRIALHMKVGTAGMIWGVVVILVGWTTTLVRFGDRLEAGDPQAPIRLFAPLTDMLFFAPFLAAAWIYRRRPEIHKRLLVAATTVLLIAAVHRMTFLGGSPPPLPQLLAVWLSPILVGMIYDFSKRRMVHPVYLIGIGAVLVMKFGRRLLADTDLWRGFVAWLTTLYA